MAPQTQSSLQTRKATHVSMYRVFTLSIAVLALTFAGCKSTPATTDASLTSTIQSTLAGDSAIGGQPLSVAVQGGVATLSGSVANDAQRSIAARDAAGIPGVTKVVNDITVATAMANSLPLTPPPSPPAVISPVERKPTPKVVPQRQPAPIERPQQAFNPPPPQQPVYQPQPQPQPTAPPPPPQPTFKTVTIPSSSTIPVRITQTLDSATTQAGTSFSGVVASDIVIDGLVAIPAGSNVSGRVDEVHEAAHFKGSSLLTISLGTITRRGERMDVSTDPYTVAGKGRGTNTAEKTAGGAAVGAILGGIFGGGKGAAIGAAAGGGVGAGSQAVTRGQQVQILSESVVRFHLTTPLTVRVRTDGGERPQGDQTLRDRPNQ